jgi:crossover junction endodeoxyribonuclease RuvC
LKILGFDPGTALLGYGVVEYGDDPVGLAFGAIDTPSAQSMPGRLLHLFEATSTLLDEHRPDAVAVEQLFFARNVTTAISVGQARGVVLLAAAQAGVQVAEYSPSAVKQAVAGYGKADKRQMQEMVRIILGLAETPRPDDAADALAVALCHGQSTPFRLRAGFVGQ